MKFFSGKFILEFMATVLVLVKDICDIQSAFLSICDKQEALGYLLNVLNVRLCMNIF